MAQLVHLDDLIHFVEPQVRLLDGVFPRRVDGAFELAEWLDVDGELTRKFEIDGV